MRLGISGGTMRADAKRLNSECVVAFDGDKAVGWATLNRPVCGIGDDINVFVSVPYRKQGIGRELVNRILPFHEKDTKLKAYPFDPRGLKLYQGFTDKIKIV